jgi:hypothetical protein
MPAKLFQLLVLVKSCPPSYLACFSLRQQLNRVVETALDFSLSEPGRH